MKNALRHVMTYIAISVVAVLGFWYGFCDSMAHMINLWKQLNDVTAADIAWNIMLWLRFWGAMIVLLTMLQWKM